MKTQLFRVSMLSLAVSVLVVCAGCEEDRAQAEVPLFTPAPVASPVTAIEATNEVPVLENTNAVPEQTPVIKVVQPPVVPQDAKTTPALAEIIKLVQAGVGEEVTMAYINNSNQPFNVSSDQIVYLNDLGVSTGVITAMLQHDSAAGTADGKNSASTSLPPGVALNTPATNIYPGNYSQQSINPPVAEAPLTPPAEQPAATSDFYGSLAPYGSWVDVDGYGLCWRPTVSVISPGWRPYCDRGRWLWTDAGWYWYSDYSWGWAPFHYGRWCSYPRLGWFWVPDTCWGPSWVSWRYSSSYCGWAPLPPAAHFVSGVGFSFHGGAVGLSFDFGLSPSSYTFVDYHHFYHRNPYNYRVTGSRTTTIYNNTTVINNYTVQRNGTVINNGVGVDRIARTTGTRIPTVAIQTAAQPVSGRQPLLEQLHNNGAALTVVQPHVTMPTKPLHLSNSAVPPGKPDPAPGGKVVTPVRTAPTDAVSGRATEQRNPRVQPERPPGRFPSRTGETTQSSPAISTPAVRTVKPLAPTATTVASAPASAVQPQPGSANTPIRTERTTLLPSVEQRAPVSPPVTAPAVPKPELSRVYPDAGNSNPGNSRREFVAPPVTRSAPAALPPAVTAPSRPQFAPAPAPSYRPEPPRNPIIRSEPNRAPAVAPSRSVESAPRATSQGNRTQQR